MTTILSVDKLLLVAMLSFGAVSSAVDISHNYKRGTILIVGTTEAGTNLREGVLAFDPASGDTRIVANDIFGSGVQFGGLVDIALGPREEVYIVDADNGILSLDLSNGHRTLLSGDGVGSGPSFVRPSGMTVGPNGMLFVVDHGDIPNQGDGAIFAVDPTNGNRTIISNMSVGSGPLLATPTDIVISSSGIAYVSDSRPDTAPAVLAIDIATGNRTAIASPSIGSGPALDYLDNVALDRSGRLFIADGEGSQGIRKVMRLDLDSFERTVISDPDNGTGPLMKSTASTALGLNGELLLADYSDDKIYAIDLDTGDRTIVYSKHLGRNVAIRGPRSMVVLSQPIPEPSTGLLAVVIFATIAAGMRMLDQRRA